MPRVDLTLEIDIERTPRVMQLEGMFDIPEAKRRSVDFHFDVPIDDKPWQIGLIVGPSGAGKTITARHLFPDSIVEEYDWHPKQSVVDSFGGIGIRDVTAALSSVGFSSPPSWTKPFHVLSNGEQFRARVARALLDERELIVLDEFTSVVDRTVAKIGSYAVAKTVRKHPRKRFVAVSCHDDIVEWLQPDWILEPHIGRFRWRSVQRRPSLELKIVRCEYSSWRWFAKHHYLTANLHKSARCFVGMIEGYPVAFAGLLYFPHPVGNLFSISRLVVIPDYQGIGLGSKSFIDSIARIVQSNGKKAIIGTAHPGLIRPLARSLHWRMKSRPAFNRTPSGHYKTSTMPRTINPQHTMTRRVAHFLYVGPGFTDPADVETAKRLWCSDVSRTVVGRTRASRARVARAR